MMRNFWKTFRRKVINNSFSASCLKTKGEQPRQLEEEKSLLLKARAYMHT